MSKKILILGANGFIGNALVESCLKNTDWEIYGMDLESTKLEHSLGHERFTFFEGDILIHNEWVEYHVKKCDVVLPLVAIANPATYVRDPLRIFTLDFEANIDIVRMAMDYKTRVIFPSTSEVYGMCEDKAFDEETSNFIVGPINKQRWIYSCSKQLLDRVIYASGIHEDLDYTLFRPFNFYGPKLDDLKTGGRVLTQFISNIVNGKDLVLVDGGKQKRCFCYIGDAIEALIKIIDNKDGKATNQIINIGNPSEDAERSVRDLAENLLEVVGELPEYAEKVKKIKLVEQSSEEYYGKGYQDMAVRRPSIENAKNFINWEPSTSFRDGLKQMVDFYLN